MCGDCKKLVLLKDSAPAVNSEGMHYRVCETCGPEKFQVTCGVCNEAKHKTNFKYHRSTDQKKNFLARCKACYTCNKCGTELDGHKFDPRMKVCRKCLKKDKTCPVCNEIKDRDLMFETGKSRCISCQFCVRCENQKKSAMSFKGNDDICINCRNAEEIFECAVQTCRQELTADHFDKNILLNAKIRGSLRVCGACAEKGYSPIDILPYECQSSPKHFAGHLNFTRRALDNFKRKLTKNLICSTCAKKEQAQEKPCKRKRGSEESKYLILSTRIFLL